MIMMVKRVKKTTARLKQRPVKQVAYRLAPDEISAVMEDTLEYMASCPVCQKRVFDISALPDKQLTVRLKCPHCRKIVQVPCGMSML
jgi:hypothetical protein